jgi:uncharacterized membrane protein YccC
VVVLPVFWSMGQLHTWWNPPLNAVVFAVLLAVGLPRALAAPGTPGPGRAASALLLGAAAAVGCAMLLDRNSWSAVVGATLFALGVAAAVWLRRLGPSWRTSGTVAALPFLAVLVHPLPDPTSWSFLGWMLLAAGVAYAWSAAMRLLTAPTTAPAASGPPLGGEPIATLGGDRRRRLAATGSRRLAESGPRRAAVSGSRHLAASSRMAIQLALAVAAAFAFGQWTDPDHLVWPVLTVLVVHSANRGRGDVLWKGIERSIGALAGTVIATLLAGLLPAGDSLAIVAIFAILALAAALQEISYAYRAACTTAALAFLYGYFDQGGGSLLTHRLLGVAAGAAIGIAAAWFVLPVRTTDLVRLRVAALLAAAHDLAAATSAGTRDRAARIRLVAADRDLAALAPTLRAARRFGRGPGGRLDHTVTQARALGDQAADLAARADGGQTADRTADAGEIAAVLRRIGGARRALRDRPA